MEQVYPKKRLETGEGYNAAQSIDSRNAPVASPMQKSYDGRQAVQSRNETTPAASKSKPQVENK